MKRTFPSPKRLLAIDPTPKGFAFAVLEGERYLIDWSLKQVKGEKNAECIRQISVLIDCYQPDVIVIEKYQDKEARRCLRVQKLIEDIAILALARKVKSHRVSRTTIRKTFSQYGTITKYQIAVKIAELFPELEPRLPRFRKPWMSEDERMSIFDAIALALTLFSFSASRVETKGRPTN